MCSRWMMWRFLKGLMQGLFRMTSSSPIRLYKGLLLEWKWLNGLGWRGHREPVSAKSIKAYIWIRWKHPVRADTRNWGFAIAFGLATKLIIKFAVKTAVCEVGLQDPLMIAGWKASTSHQRRRGFQVDRLEDGWFKSQTSILFRCKAWQGKVLRSVAKGRNNKNWCL